MKVIPRCQFHKRYTWQNLFCSGAIDACKKIPEMVEVYYYGSTEDRITIESRAEATA